MSQTVENEEVAANDLPTESAEVDEASPEESEAFAPESLDAVVESLLFAAGAPLSLKRIVEILGVPRKSAPSASDLRSSLNRLMEHYAPGNRGIEIMEVAGGYQFRTAREHARWVRTLFRDKPARLGRAALETLAIVAYKQPVTRPEIEAIRGVDVDRVLNSLLEKKLIIISGRKDAVGRPLLYTTTPEFLEIFGLKDLKDLPSLKELGTLADGDHALDENTETPEVAEENNGETAGDVSEQPAEVVEGSIAEDEEIEGHVSRLIEGTGEPSTESMGEEGSQPQPTGTSGEESLRNDS